MIQKSSHFPMLILRQFRYTFSSAYEAYMKEIDGMAEYCLKIYRCISIAYKISSKIWFISSFPPFLDWGISHALKLGIKTQI